MPVIVVTRLPVTILELLVIFYHIMANFSCSSSTIQLCTRYSYSILSAIYCTSSDHRVSQAHDYILSTEGVLHVSDNDIQ